MEPRRSSRRRSGWRRSSPSRWEWTVIDSRPEPSCRRGRVPLRALALALAATSASGLLGACASPPSPPATALEPLARRAVFPPDEADQAARDAARASLGGDVEAATAARARLDAID